jgi:hypothetical protein
VLVAAVSIHDLDERRAAGSRTKPCTPSVVARSVSGLGGGAGGLHGRPCSPSLAQRSCCLVVEGTALKVLRTGTGWGQGARGGRGKYWGAPAREQAANPADEDWGRRGLGGAGVRRTGKASYAIGDMR